MNPLCRLLKDRLAHVEERILSACERSGRPRNAVSMVAVTKTVSVEIAALLLELGCHDLGENRPQELWRKAAQLPEQVRWHMIGHLQRNKVEKTVPLVRMIHSVDSERLLVALDREAELLGRTLDVMLEVHLSGEESKQGFSPEALPAVIDQLAGIRRLRVCGLMTMAAPEDDPECCRPTFVRLRRLAEQLQTSVPLPHRLEHLSMGMSNDFEIAIEEGATLIRLGSVLFEGLPEGQIS